MKKATFPRMGPYTESFSYLAEQLGFEPFPPPEITQDTIKLGVRHSSSFVCFPFKVTLGNLIQALDNGAEVIIVPGVTPNDKPETCRFSFYGHIQEQILRRLGYKFDTLYLNGGGFNILKVLKKMNPNISYLKIVKILRNVYNKIKEIEKREYIYEPKEINIGLVGEFYTMFEQAVNYDIINKLKKMGCGVHMSLTLSWFLKHQIHMADEKKYLHEEIKKYMPKRMGGHGYESVYNTLYYSKNGFDGVIHLLPLSCCPESLVEMPIDMISQDYNIPVYRFPFDEANFEVGFDTRLSTFISLLRRNKTKNEEMLCHT